MTSPLRLAHISDTHIGYETFAVLSVSGNNLRGEDIVKALLRNVAEIVAADPPLVLYSGDVGDRAQLPTRSLLLIRECLATMAGLRPDGSRRQVVVISGNHDQPRSRRDACFLELFRGLPGLHVVTSSYEVVAVGDAENAPQELGDVLVHSIPHDQLKELQISDSFSTVKPVPGATNILMTHGTAGGSELFKRLLGREFAIPIDVLTREWDYVALGHWHKQGPVAVGGHSDATTPIWYAGSTENMGFSDLVHAGGMGRGHLLVDVERGQVPQVTRVNLPIRSMLRLETIDGTNLSPTALSEALISSVQSAPIAGAVVGQLVTGVPREIWNLVDRSLAEKAAASAIHYSVTVKHQTDAQVALADRALAESPLGDLGEQLDKIIEERVSHDLVTPVREMATALLGGALNQPVNDAPSGSDGDADADMGGRGEALFEQLRDETDDHLGEEIERNETVDA
jgi:DNA repair exonuclease SbcCD nuclease subunit